MWLLILAIVIFISLIVVKFLQVDKKVYILSALIIVLLVLHITDELLKQSSTTHSNDGTAPTELISISQSIYKNSPTRNLLKEQRELLNYFSMKWERKDNDIVVLKGVDAGRFRAMYKELQEKERIPSIEIDFARVREENLQEVFYQHNPSEMVVMVVENVQQLSQLRTLENIYIQNNVTIIFREGNELLLPFSSVYDWMTTYNFEGNYRNQILENHPPRVVELCSKYRTFDYSFYVLSQNEPLSELCMKFPSNKVTECVREYINEVHDRVPFSKVKHCLNGYRSLEGLIIENGMVSVKKDYFYSGRVDRNTFILDRDDKQQEQL